MSKQLSRFRVKNSIGPQDVEANGIQVEVLRGWVTRGNLLANSEIYIMMETNERTILMEFASQV